MIEIKNKADCCGCEACANICPKDAIDMFPDEKGFLFPKVDTSKCVDCGMCEKVCPLSNYAPSVIKDFDIYAVINKNATELLYSASGGAFSAIAHWAIDNGGIVFGCSWDSDMTPRHMSIDRLDDLPALQGSKYVQSRIALTYREVKENLSHGRLVVFSGTPCQCEGLRMYLGKDYERLVCVELICHGVPNAKFFREYLDLLEKDINGKIIDVQFRDKKCGWGALLHITYRDIKNNIKHKYLSTNESFYYYYYYLGANLCRNSCYDCKYSSIPRKSDLTIGDFWGIQKAHPEIDSSQGVSVVIASTPKGKNVISSIKNYVNIRKSSLEAASAENGQLLKHSAQGRDSDYVWKLYADGGIEAVNNDYVKRNRIKILKGVIKRKIPLSVKSWIKKILLH